MKRNQWPLKSVKIDIGVAVFVLGSKSSNNASLVLRASANLLFVDGGNDGRQCAENGGAQSGDWIPALLAVPPHAVVVHVVGSGYNIREALWVLVDERVDESEGLVVLEADVVQTGNHAGEGGSRAGGTSDGSRSASIDHVEVLTKNGNVGGSTTRGVVAGAEETIGRKLGVVGEERGDGGLLPLRRNPVEGKATTRERRSALSARVALFEGGRSHGSDMRKLSREGSTKVAPVVLASGPLAAAVVTGGDDDGDAHRAHLHGIGGDAIQAVASAVRRETLASIGHGDDIREGSVRLSKNVLTPLNKVLAEIVAVVGVDPRLKAVSGGGDVLRIEGRLEAGVGVAVGATNVLGDAAVPVEASGHQSLAERGQVGLADVLTLGLEEGLNVTDTRRGRWEVCFVVHRVQNSWSHVHVPWATSLDAFAAIGGWAALLGQRETTVASDELNVVYEVVGDVNRAEGTSNTLLRDGVLVQVELNRQQFRDLGGSGGELDGVLVACNNNVVGPVGLQPCNSSSDNICAGRNEGSHFIVVQMIAVSHAAGIRDFHENLLQLGEVSAAQSDDHRVASSHVDEPSDRAPDSWSLQGLVENCRLTERQQQ